jgi:VCBS repeat-containing protein
MSVAFRVESGDDGKAVAALLPQIIGNVQTAMGCGTIRRAGGIAVQVTVGDPVCQGDVIETMADGHIGIRFIDGTAFNLSPGTRLALDDFVCDANGTSHSALFGVTRGTFAFMAGRVARTGCLTVDTPVGSIHGRAHCSGFGMLSLTALTFSIISEVRAADPDVTILDNDSIAYKDLGQHGVLELVTKEAIPRRILVEDPGETIVLHPRGSTISVNKVANSPARMEELQAAQQDVLANFARGLGRPGSSTPPDVNSPPVQRINFIQTDADTEQNSLPPLPPPPPPVPEITLIRPPPPPPAPPTLTAPTGPIEIDTVVFDNFTAASGTFVASSPRGDALVYSISGGTAGSTILDGVAYDVSNTGPFGTLYVNSTTGAYTFVPDSHAINALKANTTESFTITVSDGTLSASQTFAINIHGANDAAIISGTTTGSVIEVRGVVNATPGTQTTTGMLTDTDVDDPANTFTAVSSPTKSAGGYGTFTMTAGGKWSYTLDSTNSAVQTLNVGNTLTDSFTVTSIDGTARVVTITIRGPMIAVTGTASSLTLSEAHLTATALEGNISGSAPDATLTTTSGDFATAFTSVQGVDGATISYALSITGGNGTASGLIDSHTGQADVLVLNGNTIEGHVGTTGGKLAFTITLDPTTGRVTFTEYRAVTQASNPDGGEGASLTAGLVNLTATITDKDGDFQTASIDLGNRLTITDDGPMIGGFSHGTIVAKDGQVANGTFNVSFGADGDSAMRVAVHNGAVNCYNLATTDLGGGITSVHVTGNGDDYTFYYTTQAVSGGTKLNAFFTDTSGTLSDPFFTLLIKPDGTYTFDIEGVGFLQQTTVSGSDFGASSSGKPSLTAPDGLLVITGDCNGDPADVKASNNGIAVGDSGLQMDQHETLLLTFTPEQTDVSFNLTQWQGNGTADVVFKVHDGATDIHDFNINIPKPSGDAHILVEKTSNLALVNTYTFDSATSTYTLYVGSDFNQIGVSYVHAVTGNTTFTVNNITYSAGTKIPSTDLLFDVTAVDGDGDKSTTSLQVDLLGVTSVASALTLSGPPGNDVPVGGTLTDTFAATTADGTAQVVTITSTGTNDAAVISGTMTGSVIEAGGAANATPGTPTASGTLTDTDVDNPSNTFTAASSPRASAGGYGSFTMTAAGVWAYTLDHANSAVRALDDGGALAPGPEVIADPPFVFGTPGGETIAGGGNDGQTVYAGAGNDTGKDDILHAGSGNDTVKGNDGDDTIYGGSGSDAINGNNGSDTIVGGFDADKLTGSNGNDRFVYLSAAGSNASLFDIISDFASGSDKIDLTALGALAFLALTSTSTSVPPRTIAWSYDSATNQTIVYVNPTDQTLSIGSSSLLEIHLQGVVTVQSSDFETAAAPAAIAGEAINLALATTAETDGTVFGMTITDGTLDETADHGDAKVQTTDLSFRFDADRDRFDFGHARFASFDEPRTQPAAEANDNAVITLKNGQLVVPHHGHGTGPTDNETDPAPVLDSANATAAHNGTTAQPGGTIQHASIAAPDTPANIAVPQSNPHGSVPEDYGGQAPSHSHGNASPETNSTVTPGNHDDVGVPGASEHHGRAAASWLAHSEQPWTHGGNHSVPADVSEHGRGAHEPSSAAHGRSGSGAAGTPGPEDSFHFRHDIAASGSSGVIELADVDHTRASIGPHGNAAGRGGPEEAQAIEPSSPGHSADHAATHAANAHIAHAQHDLIA